MRAGFAGSCAYEQQSAERRRGKHNGLNLPGR